MYNLIKIKLLNALLMWQFVFVVSDQEVRSRKAALGYRCVLLKQMIFELWAAGSHWFMVLLVSRFSVSVWQQPADTEDWWSSQMNKALFLNRPGPDSRELQRDHVHGKKLSKWNFVWFESSSSPSLMFPLHHNQAAVCLLVCWLPEQKKTHHFITDFSCLY